MHEDLFEAREKIEAARKALRLTPELSSLADRLGRMAAELGRIERAVAKIDASQPAMLQYRRMIDPSAMYHASKIAGNRRKGEDHAQFQVVSGLLMAFMGCRMALDGFNKMQAKAGKPQLGVRGR